METPAIKKDADKPKIAEEVSRACDNDARDEVVKAAHSD